MTNLDSVLKNKDTTLQTKVCIVKAMYGLSIRLWELGHKEGRALKNWCFPTVVLEKTFKSSLDNKDVNQSNLKEINLHIFIGRTVPEAEAPIFCPSDVNSQHNGKDSDAGKAWRQEKRATEDEMVGWHHWCSRHELGQTPGDGEGQGSLSCCSPWDHKESDKTWQLNNNNINASNSFHE